MRKQHMVQPTRNTKNPSLIIDTDYYRNEYGKGDTKPDDIGKTLKELRLEKEMDKDAIKNGKQMLNWIKERGR
jgi:hypothetical protein